MEYRLVKRGGEILLQGRTTAIIEKGPFMNSWTDLPTVIEEPKKEPREWLVKVDAITNMIISGLGPSELKDRDAQLIRVREIVPGEE